MEANMLDKFYHGIEEKDAKDCIYNHYKLTRDMNIGIFSA